VGHSLGGVTAEGLIFIKAARSPAATLPLSRADLCNRRNLYVAWHGIHGLGLDRPRRTSRGGVLGRHPLRVRGDSQLAPRAPCNGHPERTVRQWRAHARTVRALEARDHRLCDSNKMKVLFPCDSGPASLQAARLRVE